MTNYFALANSLPDGSNLVLAVINLDPHHTHTGFVELPTPEIWYRRHARVSDA